MVADDVTQLQTFEELQLWNEMEVEASLERHAPAFALLTLPAIDFELAAVVAALVVLLGAVLSIV